MHVQYLTIILILLIFTYLYFNFYFQGNIPQAISVVHLLADKNTQSLVLKSPIYDVHASFQVSFTPRQC